MEHVCFFFCSHSQPFIVAILKSFSLSKHPQSSFVHLISVLPRPPEHGKMQKHECTVEENEYKGHMEYVSRIIFISLQTKGKL